MALVFDQQAPGVYANLSTQRAPAPNPRPGLVCLIGFTLRGPVGIPTEIRSLSQFENVFGGRSTLSDMYDSAAMIFDEGGAAGSVRLLVVRVVASDAVAAQFKIDESGGNQKYTVAYLSEGAGNNTSQMIIRGNPNYLDRTSSPEAYTKWDVLLVEELADGSGNTRVAASMTAVQFTDSTANDYWLTKIQDPTLGFGDISITEGLGGLPADLASEAVTDEAYVSTQAFAEAIDNPPLLRGTLRLVAGGTATDDEAQTPTPSIDGSEDGFNFTLVGGDFLDNTLRIFFQKPLVTREAPTVTGTINGANTSFTIAAGGVANPIHREASNFSLEYADTTEASATLDSIGGSPATQDLSAVSSPIGGPVHPGTLVITVTIGASSETITDDGAGNLVGATALPSGGTVNYDTGALTGTTATLDASTDVDYVYSIPKSITKASSTDNMATGVVLGGDGSGTVDLVDSTSNPTQNGAFTITTSGAPLTGTAFYLTYHPLGIVNDDADGVLTGDIGTATATFTNTADPTDGSVSVIFDAAPPSGSTIDCDYETGLVITDDSEGNLIGDVLSSAANTVNYETGLLTGSFSGAPLGTTLVNYTHLPRTVTYNFASGSNGSAVARADISASSLESSQLGIYALDSWLEPVAFTLPDFDGVELVQRDILETYMTVERKLSRYYAMGVGTGKSIQGAANHVGITLVNPDNGFATVSFPNVLYRNSENVVKTLSSGVFQLAKIAQTASTDPSAAPSNSNGKAISSNIVGLEQIQGIRVGKLPTLADYETLAAARINPLRNDNYVGNVVTIYDSLTLSRTDPVYNTIHVPLLGQFLIYQINLAIQPFLQRPLIGSFYQEVTDRVTGLMESYKELRYFGDNGYTVTCNSTNNPPSLKSNGRFQVDVSVWSAPLGRFANLNIIQQVEGV